MLAESKVAAVAGNRRCGIGCAACCTVALPDRAIISPKTLATRPRSARRALRYVIATRSTMRLEDEPAPRAARGPDGRFLPAVPAEAAALAAKPWGEMTKAQRLAHNTDLALGAVKTILELEVDPANLKLLGHIKDTALGVISQQIKVDERQLSAAAEPAKRDAVLERLSAGLRERLKR
jgi:hypothetical protein